MWTSSRRGSASSSNVHNNFFEEIGKFRAARRIWAQEMRDSFAAQPTPAPTACASTPRLPASRSPRNSRRTTWCGSPSRPWLRSWAAASRCTPTARTRPGRCLRKRRRCRPSAPSKSSAHETGVTDTVDPLGGSYFLEVMTNQTGVGQLRLLPPHRRHRRRHTRAGNRVPATGDRRGFLRLPVGGRPQGAHHRRRQRIQHRRGDRHSPAPGRPRGGETADRGAARNPPPPGRAARPPRSYGRLKPPPAERTT